MGPTEHLAWSELAAHDPASTPYPEEWRESRGVPLALEFEVIRDALGGMPIRIGSAYRPPAWNRAVGGARFSQHMQGTALDLHPVHCSVAELQEAAVQCRLLPGSRLRGVGFYPWGVHIDIREGRRVTWGGKRIDSEVRRA